MSDFLTGRSGLFTFLLVMVLLVVSVALKYVGMTTATPTRVKGELDDVFRSVSSINPVSLRKAEFLKEWGEYRNSEECSPAVSSSSLLSGNGFQGDVYVVTYRDSIEFPGFPTMRRTFSIEKPMTE